MKAAIVGAGAIGSLLAARLSTTDAEVSLIARGATFETIRRHGITLVTPQQQPLRARPMVSDNAQALGIQDVVFLCVKAHGLLDALETLSPLMDRYTWVVPILNGLPWWYPYHQPAPLADRPLESVDPGGILLRAIDTARVIGATTFAAVEKDGPGRIRHIADQPFLFGDVQGLPNPMLERIVALFAKAGLQGRSTGDIRAALWVKLWGNIAFNPLSVLTGATLSALCEDPGSRAVARAMMQEAKDVADGLGLHFESSIDERIATAARVGAFKTSMLQDFEAGRHLETAGIVGTVLELAERIGIDAPVTRAILGLVEMRVRTRDAGLQAVF
jgi:2-dehydropantoate 2-reductase